LFLKPINILEEEYIVKKPFRFFVFIFFSLVVLNTYSFAEENQLGAEFALTLGAQSGPFKTDTGFFLAGEVGLPLMMAGPGRLLGLINIGVAKTDDDVTFEPTAAALGLTTQTSVDLTTVSILMGLKYKIISHNIVQPFVLGGPLIGIFLNDSDPGDLVGGIAPQPEELQDRGYPDGQGDAELGVALGGGVDFNITQKIFIGVEGRWNWVDQSNGSYGTYGGRLGFRF
jgi:opacity protein-like surface antigen